MAVLGYPGAKISLKDDVVPTLFPVVDAMLLPSIRITQAATLASTTTLHLGSKRSLSELSVRIQVMSVQVEFGPVNSDDILWRLRLATLVTSGFSAQRAY